MTVLRYAVVFSAASALGMVAALPVLVLGLVVPIYAVWPLTLGVGAAFSVVGAVWVRNLLVWGASRGRLLLVLLVCETTAMVLAGILVVVEFGWRGEGLFIALSNLEILLLAMIPISLNATILSWRASETGRRHGKDSLVTAAIVGTAMLAPVVLLLLGCPLIGCGA